MIEDFGFIIPQSAIINHIYSKTDSLKLKLNDN